MTAVVWCSLFSKLVQVSRWPAVVAQPYDEFSLHDQRYWYHQSIALVGVSKAPVYTLGKGVIFNLRRAGQEFPLS